MKISYRLRLVRRTDYLAIWLSPNFTTFPPRLATHTEKLTHTPCVAWETLLYVIIFTDSEINEGWRRRQLHSFEGELCQRNICAEFSSLASGIEQKEKKGESRAPPTTQQMSLNEPVQLKSVLIITCGRTRLKIVELNFLRCSGRLKASLVGFCMPGSSEILEAWIGRKALELWRRVFTTSSGQVTTAPAVPATLLNITTLVSLVKHNISVITVYLRSHRIMENLRKKFDRRWPQYLGWAHDAVYYNVNIYAKW